MDKIEEIYKGFGRQKGSHIFVEFTNGTIVCSCGLIQGEVPNLRDEDNGNQS